MATKRISDLTAVNLVSGSAVIPVVQDGTTVKVTFANLTGSIAGLTATPATASHALTALTASYAVSASHEITYELSSSYAETATSASRALVANTATSASFATTATTASRLYKDVAPIYVGTQQKDSLAATEMTGEVITIKSNDDTTSTPAYVVSNTDGTKFGSFGIQPSNGEVYLSVLNGGLNLLSTTGRIKASGSLDIRDSLIVRNGASGSFSGSFQGNGAGLTGVPSASYATTASIASDLYRASGPISAGIGADSNIVTISGSLIQLGSPFLLTETLVHRTLGVSGSLLVHNTLGNGYYSVGVDNTGNVQMGADSFLNISLKNDGTNVLYNGVYVSSSLTIDAGSVLTLNPVHPLPSPLVFPIPTGSFAVSGSTPVKPYFWDGSSWNALY